MRRAFNLGFTDFSYFDFLYHRQAIELEESNKVENQLSRQRGNKSKFDQNQIKVLYDLYLLR